MGNRKKYFIIDNVIIGANHVIGNAGYINYIQGLHPGMADVTFFGDSSHIDNVKSKVNNVPGNNIEYCPIEVLHPNSGLVKKVISWKKKFSIDYNTVNKILTKANHENVELVLFCTLVASNLYRFQSIFSRFPQVKIGVTLHGELEYLFNKNLSKLQVLNKLFYKRAFKNKLSNVKYIAISKLIKDKLVEARILNSNNVIFIEHPINEYERKNFNFPKTPVIAQLGVGSIRKGSDKLFSLAKSFENNIAKGEIEFQIIGKLYDDIKPYKNEFVNVLSENNKHITQVDYEKNIENATFATNFITGNEYVYRISGSLIDSIQYQLPIIALKHDYVNYLFDMGGDIGYLCDSMEDVQKIINDILNREGYIIENYPIQIENLKKLSYQFYENQIVSLFRKNMSEAGWTF